MPLPVRIVTSLAMAKFDFVESAAAGYRYVWRERHSLLPLAAMPLAVKVGSYAAIYLLDLNENVLRQGLLLLPAHFMEGFIVVLAIRMAVFGEQYHHLVKSNDVETYPKGQRRAIMAGVIVYLFTKLVSSFLSGWVVIAQQVEKMPGMPKPAPQDGGIYVTSIMVTLFLLWAFRFFWLYVPVAMGIPMTSFLERIKGFMTSVYMAGFWMLCFVPMAVILVGIAKAMMFLFPETSGGGLAFSNIVMAIVQPVIELIIALTSSVGMAYAVRAIMSDPQHPPRFF